ncbi:putative lipoprotein [Colwellia psychrerythraea 34H]|uniref:Putative lipoprotein n=2 Tax=Colwellia psychrerythraea TaxID=28229 RepID=Q47YE4_COLP3|nr:putative lipoprotein [Colwellia psychrerythraea 34H]
MFSKSIVISLVILLAGCKVTQPPSYQKDRKPEDRNEYNGTEGMVQQQKDQGYLMSKDLSDKCTEAKIDLAISESNNNESKIKKQKEIISSTCI